MNESKTNELVEAVRTYPWRFGLSIVLFLAIAVAVGLLRPATYTADARLAVGRVNVSTVAAPGVVSASQSLASAYSRAITADQVARHIERELGDITDPTADLTASPIPESPVILIEADASAPDEAIRLANAASRALISYVNELNSNAAEGTQLLRRYRTAKEEVEDLEADVDAESEKVDNKGGANLEAARLRVRVLEGAYRSSLEENTSGNDLRVLTSAQEATSDRESALKLLLIAGLVAGTGIGLVVAYGSMRM
jgi:uncharacterized protein involved in exopolysaccharide biosynthesis